MEQVTNGLVALTEQIGESDRGFAMASKMLALAEIAINSGKAIAKMVSAESGKGILGIATMASGIATILSNIANAVKIVKSAKICRRCLVQDRGQERATVFRHSCRMENPYNRQSYVHVRPYPIILQYDGWRCTY